jgi:hypothetical protein
MAVVATRTKLSIETRRLFFINSGPPNSDFCTIQ